MKCITCGKGMPEGVDLFRLNEFGVTGIWACTEHYADMGKSIDPDLQLLIDAIHSEDKPHERSDPN